MCCSLSWGSHVRTQTHTLKTLQTNPSHSCWGWYYPAAFRFGAHDFHSVTMMQDQVWEETVIPPSPSVEESRRKKGGSLGSGRQRLTHQALVMTNETVTFFRGGEMQKRIRLPRAITDCVGTIEMGGAGECSQRFPCARDRTKLILCIIIL